MKNRNLLWLCVECIKCINDPEARIELFCVLLLLIQILYNIYDVLSYLF